MKPIGRLKKATVSPFEGGGLFVKPVRCTPRRLYQDDTGNHFVKIFNKWWKFPEQVEH